jgi:toxin HigB-1
VKIRNIVHKGLKRLYAEDNAKGVPPDTVDKLRKMLALLDDMQEPDELRAFPLGKYTRWREIAKELGASALRATGA